MPNRTLGDLLESQQYSFNAVRLLVDTAFVALTTTPYPAGTAPSKTPCPSPRPKN